jgi:hypothetical protein
MPPSMHRFTSHVERALASQPSLFTTSSQRQGTAVYSAVIQPPMVHAATAQ